jgi:hypothetical protein
MLHSVTIFGKNYYAIFRAVGMSTQSAAEAVLESRVAKGWLSRRNESVVSVRCVQTNSCAADHDSVAMIQEDMIGGN